MSQMRKWSKVNLTVVWQGKKTNRWAPVLTVSMACQIKYITLCCTVYFQPFMKLWYTAVCKEAEGWRLWFRWEWMILKYSTSSKCIKIDHDGWANVDAETLDVNLSVLKPNCLDQGWYKQLCTFFYSKLVWPANQKMNVRSIQTPSNE